jgi:hypothetical protein
VDARSAETVVNYTQRLKMEREVEKRADLQTRILRHDPQAAYRILAYAKAIRAHLEQEALALRDVPDNPSVEHCLSVQCVAEALRTLGPLESLLTSLASNPVTR